MAHSEPLELFVASLKPRLCTVFFLQGEAEGLRSRFSYCLWRVSLQPLEQRPENLTSNWHFLRGLEAYSL